MEKGLIRMGPCGVAYLGDVKVSEVLYSLANGQESPAGKRQTRKLLMALAGEWERPLGPRERERKRPQTVDWERVGTVIAERKPREVWVGVAGKWAGKSYCVWRNGEKLFPERFSLSSVNKEIQGLADDYLFSCGTRERHGPTVVWPKLGQEKA